MLLTNPHEFAKPKAWQYGVSFSLGEPSTVNVVVTIMILACRACWFIGHRDGRGIGSGFIAVRQDSAGGSVGRIFPSCPADIGWTDPEG